MRFTKVAASIVATTAVSVLAGGYLSPAGADVSVTDVGWWTSSAVPPTAPDGGIAVGNDPSGFSIAALRLDIGGGASSANLKLVETANQVDKLASMQVCGAADSWAPANGGAAGQAPTDTCSAGSVQLVLQPDGSWTADLHQLLAGQKGTVSVIVKPANGAGAFQLAFERPTVDGATIDSSSSDSSSSSSSSEPVTSSDSSSSSATSSSPSGTVDSGSSGFASPSFTTSAPAISASDAPAVAAPAAASPAPAAAATTPAASTSADDGGSKPFKANVKSLGSTGHHSTRGTALGLFVLSLFIGALVAAASWAKEQGYFAVAGLRQRFSR